MKVLLLIAGRSRRFWPLSEKTLFPICGTNLLEITTGRLMEAGLRDIILIGGSHNLEEVSDKYPQFPSIEQKDLELGMRGALLDALPQCGSESVMIVCVNDVIESSAYKHLVSSAKQSATQGALLAQKTDRYFPGGYLQIDNNRVTSIIEKPQKGSEPSNLVNIVAHVHNDASLLLEELKKIKDGTDDGYEQALDTLFKKHTYRAVPYEGVWPWQAVKYPWHMLELLPLLLKNVTSQQIHPSAEIHPSAVVDGPVIIEEGVKIFPFATIKGPCTIGKRSIIANNALIRGSSIGDDCVVGFASEIKSSILHSHVWTHSTYIGDSIIGSNVSFGAGSVTGNLRLDEAEINSNVKNEEINTGLTKFGTVIGNNCRIGIHTGINPGKKIGGGTFIGSHVLVEDDIPDSSFVSIKNGVMCVKPNHSQVPLPEERSAFRSKIVR
ncbi:NTP transferase domain-containing protein [Patescibacteria group bacterium]|nr:NTP transferase domain-containing protein [Patescibacteria group bacterium]